MGATFFVRFWGGRWDRLHACGQAEDEILETWSLSASEAQSLNLHILHLCCFWFSKRPDVARIPKSSTSLQMGKARNYLSSPTFSKDFGRVNWGLNPLKLNIVFLRGPDPRLPMRKNCSFLVFSIFKRSEVARRPNLSKSLQTDEGKRNYLEPHVLFDFSGLLGSAGRLGASW